MLNGIDPIIIFNFRKNIAPVVAGVPVVAQVTEGIDLPLIPIYLSEKLTGLFIDQESKSIEVQTTAESTTEGKQPDVNQKLIASTVRVTMLANKNSIGVSLVAALADLVVPKLTSKEYSITYLHGATTVFGSLLHSFNVEQNAENDLLRITLELSNASKKETKPEPSVTEVTPRAQSPAGVIFDAGSVSVGGVS